MTRKSPSIALLSLILQGATLLPLPAQTEPDDSVATPAKEDPLYLEAMQAIKDHLPEVAASKLQKLISSPRKFDARTSREIEEKLCESLIRSGQNENVIEQTEDDSKASEPNPVLLYWRGVALANLGRFASAQSILEKITAVPSQAEAPWFDDALLTRVSILRKLGAPGEALGLLQKFAEAGSASLDIRLQIAELQILLNRFDEATASLPSLDGLSPSEQARVRYLAGRIALGERRWDNAINAFQGLSSGAKLPPRLRRAAAVGLADALEGSAQRKEAVDLLLRFIAENPTGGRESLFPMFERLERMEYFAAPDISPALLEWSRSENPDLAAIASYFVAVSQHSAISAEAAIASFRGFVSAFPDHFLVDRARLRLSELFTETGDKESTLATLAELEKTSSNPAVLARITFLRARSDYSAEDFKEAADRFRKASASSNSEARPAATFNAALAALKAELKNEQLDTFAGTVANLNDVGLEGEWQLERGLYHGGAIYRAQTAIATAREAETAMQLLTKFVEDHPEHPRIGEAHLALASLFLLEFPSKPKSARAHLDLTRTLELSPKLQEEADYISIWIEGGEGNDQKQLSISEAFLKDWPQSAHAPEVLMKQAELYLRMEDFPNAQIRFDILADRYPNATEAEPALFFAGKAAMRIGTDASMEDAIVFWEKLAQKGGRLALEARHHQAIVKRIQNKDSEAIALFDAVLAGEPDPDLFFSVLCAKGETIFRTADSTPEALAPVIDVFQTALSRPDIPAKWRNQCLYRLGESYEKAGDNAKALEAYYDCINSWKSTVEQMPPSVYEWFYRCGHAAMRILESQENWPAAIAIAKRVGSIPGQRAQEALDHARQLELKHIIWDDE